MSLIIFIIFSPSLDFFAYNIALTFITNVVCEILHFFVSLHTLVSISIITIDQLIFIVLNNTRSLDSDSFFFFPFFFVNFSLKLTDAWIFTFNIEPRAGIFSHFSRKSYSLTKKQLRGRRWSDRLNKYVTIYSSHSNKIINYYRIIVIMLITIIIRSVDNGDVIRDGLMK